MNGMGKCLSAAYRGMLVLGFPVLVWLCIGSYSAGAQQGKTSQENAPEKIVNLYAWADYFDPSVLDDFTKETGIKIAYDTYPTNEALDAHLAAKTSGDDVVVISGPLLQKAIASSLLQKLDKSKLPSVKSLWPEIMAYLAVYDPGNLYALNYTWFTLGFTFNAETMQTRQEQSALASWDTLFRPELLKKFADCGVEVQDSPDDLFAAALHYLKLDPHSKSPVDLKRAADLLYGLRRNVKKFRAAGDLSDLADGDACLTIGWSSDASQARKQAQESASGVTIGYETPRGGSLLLLDNFAIPKEAPHPDAALALIDYLMRPDIAARNTKATHFANGVLASKAFIPSDILTDPSIYPDPAAMKSFFTAGSYAQQQQALIAREWVRVKTGK
jgi:putrescine transport system substrate-binding protein